MSRNLRIIPHAPACSVKWMFCINSVFFPSHVIISSFQLVLRCDVAAGRHGPADVGEGGGRVPGEGFRHYPGWLRPLRSRGLQGQPLHHQQDPAGRPDPIPDRGPDVHWSPFPPQLLQAALPGHHAPDQARPQEGREGRRQIRLRRQRKCSYQTKFKQGKTEKRTLRTLSELSICPTHPRMSCSFLHKTWLIYIFWVVILIPILHSPGSRWPAIQERRNPDNCLERRGELVDGEEQPGSDGLHSSTLCREGNNQNNEFFIFTKNISGLTVNFLFFGIWEPSVASDLI